MIVTPPAINARLAANLAAESLQAPGLKASSSLPHALPFFAHVTGTLEAKI
jgi:hypothetical protein